jgi:hypothetical protein
MAMADRVSEQTMTRIMCMGWAGPNADSPAPSGLYLASYDPEGNAGQGAAAWTDDPDLALQFPTMADANACYMAVPASRPVRRDGKPNRPLTAFSVMFD